MAAVCEPPLPLTGLELEDTRLTSDCDLKVKCCLLVDIRGFSIRPLLLEVGLMKRHAEMLQTSLLAISIY